MHRKRFLIPLIAALLVGGLLAAAPAARGEDSAANRIPQVKFTDYRLPNGLRVILSTDKSAPVVAVSVVYDVGSRNERPGRSGFAHLFEHMMFQGSENVGKGEHIMLLQDNGGSMNGTTNQDRTNYFETVPANQLELALFLESDRMRSLDISQANLDNQRAVVQEERRQSYDNRAYGQMGETLLSMLFTSFAYKHSTIGSMADLNAATLEDVRQFFKTYYAPNNACIAVVGDFEEGKAKKLIEKYFGPIPRQTDPPKPDVTESPLTSVQRKTLTDPLARLVRYEMDFKTVQSTHPDAEALEILASILSSGRTGRLYSAITEKRLALAADASSYTGRGPGAFSLEGTLPPGGSVEALEAAFDAEIDKVRTEGVTEAELQKAKTQARARTIVGGGGGRAGLQTALGKANMLAQNAIFWNDPGRFNTQIQRIQAVTAADVKRVANTYLKKDARVVLVDGPATAPTAGGGQ